MPGGPALAWSPGGSSPQASVRKFVKKRKIREDAGPWIIAARLSQAKLSGL